MDEPRKLTAGELHMLRFVRRDAKPDGWTTVSDVVAPVFVGRESYRRPPIPPTLCEFEQFADGSGQARLTQAGNNLLDAMAWL